MSDRSLDFGQLLPDEEAGGENIPTLAPPGFKLLAWEGVGLFVPQRWEIGRHEGDHRRGLFRVDDEARVVIQARWWTAARPIPIDDLVREHAKTVHGRRNGPPPRFTRAEGLGLGRRENERAVAFEAEIAGDQSLPDRELLVIWQKESAARVLMLRFLVERGQPARSRIRAMLSGLRLQGREEGRDFAVLDFAVRSPPGYRLEKGVLKAGVCYLEFRNGRRILALRRFSAADAAMGTPSPGLEDLERWCRMTYAAEFYDMRYGIEFLHDSTGRPLLRLEGKRRLMAPIEMRWLIPRHRRLPRRIDVIWDAAANKIYSVELLRPYPEMGPEIDAFERSLRLTLAAEPPGCEVETEPARANAMPDTRLARLRSLRARVRISPEATVRMGENGRAILAWTVERPRSLRLLRLLGGLPAGPEKQAKKLELDMIGSLVWRECGRNRRVCEIIDLLRERFRISHREAELSVTDFIRSLGARGLLGVELETGPVKSAS
ncbi:MAG: PqqD family protein [Kiritimatiellia bacterium]